MKTLRDRFLREESGLTIIEVLIAAIILVAGALATFEVFDAAARNKVRTEQRQVALDRAQREIEKLHDVAYGKLALTSSPVSSSDQNDPRWRVSGTDFALNRDGSSPATMVVNGGALFTGGLISGGTIDPGPEHFVSGNISGDIFRFVVWRADSTCTVCAGSQHMKRVIVVVRVDASASGGQRPYVETQSDFINPADSSVSDLPAASAGQVSAQQFFLTDTPCATAGTTTRVAPSADHLLHNTLGVCANGLKTGTTAGAPDALVRTAVTGLATDPTYDYASEAALETTPNTDIGLQLLRQDVNGCAYSPGGSNPQMKIHRWVTDQMASNFSMSGNATFEIKTQTINDAQMPGKICVYLFTRAGVVDTRLVDSGTSNPYFTYQSAGNWPSVSGTGGWRSIRVNMQFPALTVLATQRLGVAISLERSVSTGDAFQFMYDHPAYVGRVEVDTTTPILG